MNINGLCTICKQELIRLPIEEAARGQRYYIEHHDISDCLKSLGSRIEALEEEVREATALSRLGL